MPQYLTLSEAARLLPGRPHKATIRRWMLKGVSGVSLRSVRLGKRRFTTEQWCSEFVRDLAARQNIECDHAAADAELTALGVK